METFDFGDMRLIARKCIVKSRSECDVSAELGGFKFKLPIMPANMKSVINSKLAISLAERGYFYVMHRFADPEARAGFAKQINELNAERSKQKLQALPISISIGVGDADKEVFEMCKGMQIDFITLDIAHAHSDAAADMIRYARSQFPKAFITAGNIMTPEAADFLIDAGANALKVGIGPGSVCTTKLDTGFGSAEWQASCLQGVAAHVKKNHNGIKIVADGGIRNRGDIAKALVCGANFIMVGSRLAGFEESPGSIIQDNDGVSWKAYYGSASSKNKGAKKNIEGRHSLLPLKGSIFTELEAQEDALKSSVSYAGGKDLTAFASTEFVLVH